MEVNLDLYRIFVSVASNGSVSKAAEELSVTQSAVSQQVAKLESIVKKGLFIRSRQGVTLTDFGKKLYAEVSPQVKQLELALNSVLDSKKSEGLIKIGASGTITENLLLPVIKKYFEGKNIYIESLMSDKEKIMAVENGLLDFAIINDYNLPLASSLYKRRLISLGYGFFYNANLLDIDGENLFQQTLILKNSGTKGRVEFNKKYYGFAYKFNHKLELSHDDIIISACRAGLGIGFCPVQYVRGSLKELYIEGERVTKNVVLIYQQESEIIRTIVEEIRKNS